MSGWTALTAHPSKTLQGENRKVANRSIEEMLSRLYGDEATSGYADRTVQIPRGADHEAYAEEVFFNLLGTVEYIVIVSANDTSDSGYGTVWDCSAQTLEKVDEIHGYEGAKARDVVGEIEEKYGVSGYASFEA